MWVDLGPPDRPNQPREERLLLCTAPDLPAIPVVQSSSRRWSVEPLFSALKHGWGVKEAWQRSRPGLMRWVPLLAVGYALNQMRADTDPARIPGLADPAPWRPPGTQTAGLIQAGIARLLRVVGLPALIAAIGSKFNPDPRRPAEPARPSAAKAA